MNGTVRGTVRWFSNERGYGFIGLPDGSDVFCHYSGIAGEGYKTLIGGQDVELEIVEGPRGLIAANVKVVTGRCRRLRRRRRWQRRRERLR